MQFILSLFFLISFPAKSIAQGLFTSEEILKIKLHDSIDALIEDRFNYYHNKKYLQTNYRKKLNHKKFFTKMSLNSNEKDIHISLSTRGKLRLTKCDIPPLYIKIEEEVLKESLLAGHKKLKLVLPCNGSKRRKEHSLIREYIAYKLYQGETIYSFKTRFVEVSYINNDNKKVTIPGFLIESYKGFERRTQTTKIKSDQLSNTLSLSYKKSHPYSLDLKTIQDSRNALKCIQDKDRYSFGKNSKLFRSKENENIFYKVEYDFNISNLVLPPFSNGIIGMLLKEDRRLKRKKCKGLNAYEKALKIYYKLLQVYDPEYESSTLKH